MNKENINVNIEKQNNKRSVNEIKKNQENEIIPELGKTRKRNNRNENCVRKLNQLKLKTEKKVLQETQDISVNNEKKNDKENIKMTEVCDNISIEIKNICTK